MSQGRSTPRSATGCRRAPRAAHRAVAVLACSLALAAAALAQVANPVYLDDSPAAEEGLHRAREMAQGANLAEAARVLQKLLDDEGDRVTSAPSDADLFMPVRARVHQLLLDTPALLRRYRDAEEPTAKRMLDDGAHAEAERTRLLTPSGFGAAVRVAWSQFERARFWGALRTIEPLETHPDIASGDPRAAEARSSLGALAAALAARIEDDAGRAIAARLAQAAGAPFEDARPAPGPEITLGVTPMTVSPEVTTDGLLSKPLWSEPLSGSVVSIEEMPEPEQPADGSPFTTAMILRILPTVAGDTIFVNTGQELNAWDRLTLTPKWKRREYPGPQEEAMRGGGSRGLSSAYKDASTVTVWGPWVAFTTGVAREGRREGDGRIHVVEAATGRELWAVNVAAADPSLLESWARGPIEIDQNVVVAAAYKFSQQRRLSSIQLLGFEAATGELLWRRPLGSAGVAPYGAPTMEAADAGTVTRGAVVRCDRLGVISSVDIASGRVLWARRRTPDATARRDSQPWESHAPIAANGRIYTLTPDRRAALELDERTGALIGEMPSALLGEPEYLVWANGLLGCVQAEQVTMVEPPLPSPRAGADEPGAESRTWRAARVADAPNFRGRVVAAHDRLLIPVVDGVLVAPARPTPDAQAQRLRLDRPGAIVVLPDQLVVADDYQVHTYLLWDVAERMLSERIKSEPDDPTPAVTYAELAHRAGRLESIIPAADLAAGAIARGAGSERAESARRRLFSSILVMLDNPGDRRHDSETPPEARVGAGLPDAVAAGLVERAVALAGDPQERAAALLVSGAFAENRGQPARAVLAYQTALTDPALASSAYTRPGASTRTDLEASRRLRRLIASHGRGVYAAFDAEADRALAAVQAKPPSAEVFEDLAERYPVALAGSRALLLAADLYERGGEPGRAALAVEQALLASRDALIDDRALLGELHGRLVRALDATGRPRAALAALTRIRATGSGLTLTDRGAPIDADALERSLGARLATLERRPGVGDLVPDQTPQIFTGWRLVEPVITSALAPADRTLVYSTQTGEVACFGPAEGGAPGVRALWSIAPAPGLKVVRVDAEGAIISEDARAQRPSNDRGGANPARNSVLKRVSLLDGSVAWETPPFRSLFDPDTERQPRGNANRTPVIYTPRGALPATDTLVAADQRTIVLIERSGRAAAFDAQTGATLWTNPSLMRRVHDAWADAGALAVVGQETGADDREDRVFGAPIVLALDARTGRTLHREVSPLGQARWVRVSSAGRVISGHDTGLSCVDAFSGQSRWRVQDARVRGTDDAWVFAGRCAVIDDEDVIWQVSEDDGRIRPQSLDTPGLRRPAAIAALELGDRAVFLTSAGLAMFDPSGRLVGRDARWGVGAVLPGAWADGQFITIDSATANPTATDSFTVRRLSAESGALLGRQAVRLGATPEVIGAIDGRILVTAGDVTVVYDAPEQKGRRGEEPPRPGAEAAPIPYPEPAQPPPEDAPEGAEAPAPPQR